MKHGISSGSRKRISFFLLCLPLFISVDLSNISPVLETLVNICKVLSFIVSSYLYFTWIKHNKISIQFVLLCVALCILLVSTILNKGSIEQFCVVWGGFAAVCMLTDVEINKNCRRYIFVLCDVMTLLVLLNAISVLLFPEGIWKTRFEGYWIFGHRNNFGIPILASLVLTSLRDSARNIKMSKRTILLCIAAAYSVVMTWSASSIVIVVIMIGLVILSSFNITPFVGKPAQWIIGYFVIDFGVVFLNIQQYIDSFIENVLHRSASLTGRVQLWDIVMSKIPEDPVIGHGIQLSKNNGLTAFNPNFVHAHNGELDILYTGGIALFLVYLAFIIIVIKNVSKNFDLKAIRIAFFGFVLILIHAIQGLFFSSYSFLILFLLANAHAFKQEADQVSEGK